MELLLEKLAETIAENIWVAPFIAIFAGMLASLMPCSLPTVPLIIAYVGGSARKNWKKAFVFSVVFAAGSAVSFVCLALIAVTAGRLLGFYSRWWLVFLAVLMFVMALQVWEIVNLIPSFNILSKNKYTGFAGAFTTGILAGIFSSPCSTPVLITLLTVIAADGNTARGVILMLCYALGHGFLSIIAATSVSFVQKLSDSRQYNIIFGILKYITGTAILLTGIYMLYLAF